MKHLVLIGGGHSHAIALKQFGKNPISGVKITLITDVIKTPYSGMLPGYIAGFYTYNECHIDLRPLSQFAHAEMIVDQAVGLDLINNRIFCANSPPISFDILSIDIGSTPATVTVPGATEHTIPVKPISKFINSWNQHLEEIHQNPHQKRCFAIVGGGAGGVELTLNLQSHLNRIYCRVGDNPSVGSQQRNTSDVTHLAVTSNHPNQPLKKLEFHLFHRTNQLLPERHPSVGKNIQNILIKRGVNLHLQENVNAIETDQTGNKIMICDSGLKVKCNSIFWVTQAAASPWLKESGLATDERGFVFVNDALQSISHPQVFAAGDVATLVNHPRPKAGVFAVRQGKPLFDNLCLALQNKPLKPFIPQKEFLILIGTGDEKAIASRSFINLGPYSVLWHWKDWIDRQFMNQFKN